MNTESPSDRFLFVQCVNWNTSVCPNNAGVLMALAKISWPEFHLLDKQTVNELDKVCSNCDKFVPRQTV